MERGLIWLPLLALFIGLAWAGWNDYQKVEAYRLWARPFKKSKYDIYALLAYNGNEIVWGKPTRQGPANLTTIPLSAITAVELWINQQPVDLDHPPTQGKKITIQLSLKESQPVEIPFTEVALALEWAKYLTQELTLNKMF